MPEFLQLLPPSHALQRLLDALPETPVLAVERIAATESLGRMLAIDVLAPHPLPPFRRSTVDGYAAHAADTHGASAALPAYLEIVGEVLMGAASALTPEKGQAALIHTGGMLPEGTDAVVMLEDTQRVDERQIEVLRPVAAGEHVLQIGEDVQAGEQVLAAGERLGPAEIGGLMALGITEVDVFRRPLVGILSTGDEIVPPRETPSPGQVRDVNSYSLSAWVEQIGGEAVRLGIVRDDRRALAAAARQALGRVDVLLITAGSSVSARDHTVQVIRELGEPGVLVHGVSIKPGKPTILAIADGMPVLGLPGNPVSALVVSRLFLPPLMRRLAGAPPLKPAATIAARMSENIASQTGREDYLPVRLVEGDDGWLAEPVYGRSNLIFTLVRADGLVRIPPAATGLAEGEQVAVRLF